MKTITVNQRVCVINETIDEVKSVFQELVEEKGILYNENDYRDVILSAGMSNAEIEEIVSDLYNEFETEKHL